MGRLGGQGERGQDEEEALRHVGRQLAGCKESRGHTLWEVRGERKLGVIRGGRRLAGFEGSRGHVFVSRG